MALRQALTLSCALHFGYPGRHVGGPARHVLVGDLFKDDIDALPPLMDALKLQESRRPS